uniref:3-hydroxyisobutyryl-CoA hydrolase n=1 Tax=Pyrodinium bahamense TaxID=73915 RepID=A0A7S0FG40_9DINO|mmetsp:Transcript_29533/g.81138  ORF Transcript_29533/g.81138 Transcript_29533/m.81138 type:complete len:352 (+) Transcript_29533:103-1158(+)
MCFDGCALPVLRRLCAAAPQPNAALPLGLEDNDEARGERLRTAPAGLGAELERRTEDGVCIISLGGGGDHEQPWGTKAAEHRLYPAAVLALDRALDAAEDDPSVAAVILTAEGKYFSNGFDLKFLQRHANLADDLQRATELLCARILRFPKPTVAAVNGHACAAGAMLMLCLDKCVMNADRGFCFVPGVDLGLTYSPGMSALMAARLPFALRHDFIVLGDRFTATSLSAHGVVTACPTDRVLPIALEKAKALRPKAKHGSTLSTIKATLYHEAIAALEVEPDAIIMDPRFVAMGFGSLAEGVDRPAPPQEPTPRPSPRDLPTRASSLALLRHGRIVDATVQSQKDLRKWAA